MDNGTIALVLIGAVFVLFVLGIGLSWLSDAYNSDI